MKKTVKRLALLTFTLYASGLMIAFYAYQHQQVASKFVQYYLYAGILLAIILYRLADKYSDKYKVENLIKRNQAILHVQSATSFFNYSLTALPIPQIESITIAQGYLSFVLKNQYDKASQQMSHEFFFDASKSEIHSHLFSLLSDTELNKIQVSLLAE